MRRVAQWLRDDRDAREELARLERSLEPLAGEGGSDDSPPADLIARTMAALPPIPSSGTDTSGEDHHRSGRLVPMQSGVEVSKNSNITWIDWVSGSVAAVILLGLLLPSLAQGRFEARKIACQNQLRQLGIELTSFVDRNQQSRLPAVAEIGPKAFAGVYAMRLREAGLLAEPSIRWCPSVDPYSSDEVSGTDLNEVASTDDLQRMPVDRLRRVQRVVGGHYAYTLGVIDQDHFTPPRYEARSSFAVMSDAPMVGVIGGKVRADRIGHGGQGINVLYEDGRVQFLSLSSLESMRDHPLLNHRGRVEAGVNIDDASLAPSWQPPFPNVRQR